MTRFLALVALLAVGIVALFVEEIWRISRDLDVTPVPTPEPDDDVVGMPTFTDGYFLVGEHGPELIYIPTGTGGPH